MLDPKQFLAISGFPTLDSSGGYTRFANADPRTNFVGLETSQIQPVLPADASQIPSSAAVPILSRLAISDYPELPPPLSFNPGLAVHLSQNEQPVEHPNPPALIRPRLFGYCLTDDTFLTATEEDGQVVGLCGKSASGHSYSLKASLSTVVAQGRNKTGVVQSGNQNVPKVTWLVANLRISKDGVSPVAFGFSYAPEAVLFEVHTFQNNVVNTIVVDLAASVVEQQTGNLIGTTNLTRYFNYYNVNYSNQNLVVPATTLDAQFHLANQATLWPYLSDVALFADAFAQLGGNAPQLAQSPYVAIGSLNYYVPPPHVSVISEQITSSIVPSFGPLAASCLSSDDSAVGLKAAAIWLAGLLLTTGSGKAAVQTVAQAFYNTQYADRFEASTSSNSSGAAFRPDPVMMEG